MKSTYPGITNCVIQSFCILPKVKSLAYPDTYGCEDLAAYFLQEVLQYAHPGG